MDLLVLKSKANRIPDRMKEITEQGSIKLQSEVSNLVRYPDASRDIANPPTVLEASLVNKLPRRLFDLLYTYNDAAILNVPNVGVAFRDHKIAYYGFRQRVTKLEASLMPRIGEMVKVQLNPGWKIYLDYLVVRFGGNS